MSLSRQKLLVNKLIEKTDFGLIDWKSTFDDDTYQIAYSKSSLQLSMRDQGSQIDYYISIINSEGKIVDLFSDVQLDEESIGENISWYTKLNDLFSKARRRALGSDEVLEDLIREIDDELPF